MAKVWINQVELKAKPDRDPLSFSDANPNDSFDLNFPLPNLLTFALHKPFFLLENRITIRIVALNIMCVFCLISVLKSRRVCCVSSSSIISHGKDGITFVCPDINISDEGGVVFSVK